MKNNSIMMRGVIVHWIIIHPIIDYEMCRDISYNTIVVKYT